MKARTLGAVAFFFACAYATARADSQGSAVWGLEKSEWLSLSIPPSPAIVPPTLEVDGSQGNSPYNITNSQNTGGSYFQVYVGTSTGGVINQSAGTLSTSLLSVGAGASGTFNLSGGTFTPGAVVYIAAGTQGTMTQTGGTVEGSPATMFVGYGATGTYSIGSSGSLLKINNIAIGNSNNGSGSGNGTVNLNGGTIQTGSITKGDSGTSTFNFNGGTLKASVDNNSTFFYGLNTAEVFAGGAVIDTNGHNVTISQALLHAFLTDGSGLTKNGSGILTLTAVETYTGTTTANSGSLILGDGTNSAALSAYAPSNNFTPAQPGLTAVAVNNDSTTIQVQSHASVMGGDGGFQGNPAPHTRGTAGGVAIIFNGAGLLSNSGTLTGGEGGLGTGYNLNPFITDGGPGATAVSYTMGGTLSNSGTITGGAGGDAISTSFTYGGDAGVGGQGGAGVSIGSTGTVTITNTGSIFGGNTGASGPGYAGLLGGTGVTFAAASTWTNGGIITGGVGSQGDMAGAGGIGVSMPGGSFTNNGTVRGGQGGAPLSNNANGGWGGIGVSIATGSLTNNTTIRGGDGASAASGGGRGGEGEAAISYILSNSTPNGAAINLTNYGSMTGGNGGASFSGPQGSTDGGPALVLANGASVTNYGTISGGMPGTPAPGFSAGFRGRGVTFGANGGPISVTNKQGASITGGVALPNFANNVTLEIGSTVISQVGSAALSIGGSSSTLTLTDNGTGSTQTYSTAVQGTTTFSGSLTKNGSGTWILDQSFTYGGGTTVNAGTLTVNNSLGSGLFAIGANGHAVNNGTIGGNVSVSGLLSGCGTINGSLSVNLGGIVNFDGCAVTVNGAITNDGLFIVRGGATLAGNSSSFTNHGTFDISTGGSFSPPGFTNSGTIIDSSVIKAKSVQKSSTTVMVAIDSYTGHSYQLQKSTTTPAGANFSNLGSPQQGNTGTVLTFNDSSATESKDFYRIAVE
jgi:fibronectin-binding autotransporter adhesin